jgi:succinate dehydrogenase/fumarate reductase flavoprotein subunit
VADLVVAGAGMAGLVAAAHARERGAEVLLYEKLAHAGGSMLLSSGVVWRHRDLARFRQDCPGGDDALQRLVLENLDAALDWLEAIGAPVIERDTGNQLTAGVRFEPAGLTAALVRAAGEVRLSEPMSELPRDAPVILATGGFPANRELVRRHITPEADHLAVRAAGGNVGDGLRLGLAAGGVSSAGLDEAYGRNMPAPPARIKPDDLVRFAQLYGQHAEISNVAGETYEARTWSEIDVFQWTCRQSRARAWFTVPEHLLSERVRDRTVGEMIEAAVAAGAPVRRRRGFVTIETVAGITSTLGGLAVDSHARVTPGVFAAGDDIGGIATGGYASGLAAALVLGRIAADAALEEAAAG